MRGLWLFIPLIFMSCSQAKVTDLNKKLKPGFTGEITLVLTNNINGKIEPCGCSGVKNGGFARLHNYVKEVRERSQNVVLLDGGDILGERVFPHKVETFLRIIDVIGYDGITIGEEEIPYLKNVYKYAKTPVVLSNDINFSSSYAVDSDSGVEYTDRVFTDSWGNQVRVRVWGALSPALLGKYIKNDISLVDSFNSLKAGGKTKGELAIDVLLLHGDLKEARTVARMKLGFEVIVASHEGPSLAVPLHMHDAYIVRVDPQGMYLGKAFLNVFSGVLRDVDFEVEGISSLKDPENDVQKIILEYRKSLKTVNALRYFSEKKTLPGSLSYLGAEKCRECHKRNFVNWKKTKHSNAFKALKEEVQDYNPDCVICHTLGYEYISGFVDGGHTPQLSNVQCENCHGPGSGHAAEPAKNTLLIPVENVCLRCHTDERDAHFDFTAYIPRLKCGE